MLLAENQAAESQSDRKTRLAAVIKDVAKRLGNTPAVCRKCYVHPDIVETYMESGRLDLQRKMRHVHGLLPEETFVLALLRKRAKETDAGRTVRQLQQSLRRRKKKAA
jgi:DNA topoisomerase-1